MPVLISPAALGSAHQALTSNRRGGITVPHARMFPGAYLWDTALIVKGLAVFDPERAAAEVLALLGAQWRSGMLPNEVHLDGDRMRRLLHGRHEAAPEGIVTSAITQPPTIVRSVLEVGRRLDRERRDAFHRIAFPALARLCRWVLTERVGSGGLAVVLHPYETGMDNRTDLADAMAAHWLGAAAVPEQVPRRGALTLLAAARRSVGDLRTVPLAHRSSHQDVLAAYLQTRHIRRYGYDLGAIEASGRGVLIEDVGYNAVFLDALGCLRELAAEPGLPDLDDVLGASADRAYEAVAQALDGLWQPGDGSTAAGYTSRDHRTGELLAGEHVATLYPLLVERRPERIRAMVDAIADPARFGTRIALPSMAADSARFTPDRYWQGPVWPFPTDIVHTALTLHGEHELAADLRRRYLTRPGAEHHAEYDNPLTGAALGARPFSPSAALAIHFADVA